jgi:hypothetical protein
VIVQFLPLLILIVLVLLWRRTRSPRGALDWPRHAGSARVRTLAALAAVALVAYAATDSFLRAVQFGPPERADVVASLPLFVLPLGAAAAVLLLLWRRGLTWTVLLAAGAAGFVAGRLAFTAAVLRDWGGFDLETALWLLRSPGTYDTHLLPGILLILAGALLLQRAAARSGEASRGIFASARPTRKWEHSAMKFAHSHNEPRRLLVSAARLGRFPGIAALLEESKHPCRAKPLSLGVSTSEVVAAAEECESERLGDALAYSGIAFAVLVLWAAVGEAAFLVGLAGAAIFLRRRRRYRRFADDFLPAAFDAAAEKKTSPNGLADDTNLVTFRGYDPFATFGSTVYNIYLVVDVERPSEDVAKGNARPKLPAVDELERRIVASLARSGLIEGEASELFFAQGKNLPVEVAASDAPPRSRIEPALGRLASVDAGSRLRRYLWLRRSTWDGEILVSYFLRVVRIGSDLTFELHGVFAPPVSASYRWVDKQPERTWRSDLADLGVSVPVGLAFLALAPLYVAYRTAALFGVERARRTLVRGVKEDPMYDFGAPNSLRARAADGRVEQYFQLMDRLGLEQAFVGRITREYIDYLEELGIDTTELRERRTMILNHGVIVQGGELNATNVAAGTGASIDGAGAAPKRAGAGQVGKREAA